MRKKILGLSVLLLSGSILTTVGCDDNDDSNPADGGTLVGDGGPMSDTNPSTTPDTGGDTAVVTSARAVLSATVARVGDAGASMAAGTVLFTQAGNAVTVQINLLNTPPGDHGMHIHVNPSCADTPAMGDAGLVPAGGAGSHWNPTTMVHGVINSDGGAHHAGDLGNVTVGANGTAAKTFTTMEWAVKDLIGLSLILHADADDLKSDPTGKSGARIACAVINAL